MHKYRNLTDDYEILVSEAQMQALRTCIMSEVEMIRQNDGSPKAVFLGQNQYELMIRHYRNSAIQFKDEPNNYMGLEIVCVMRPDYVGVA